MSFATRNKILKSVRTLFAQEGAAGVSMRTLGKKIGITQSVLYYYFPDKEKLLRAMFDETNTELGRLRAKLPRVKGFQKLFEQRIRFQFDQAEAVTAVLKYYLHRRKNFSRQKSGGFVPVKAALHIEEVLHTGRAEGILSPDIDIPKTAKVIAHAINGFVMEYYPHRLVGKELNRVVRDIASFLLPALLTEKSIFTRKGGERI